MSRSRVSSDRLLDVSYLFAPIHYFAGWVCYDAVHPISTGQLEAAQLTGNTALL